MQSITPDQEAKENLAITANHKALDNTASTQNGESAMTDKQPNTETAPVKALNDSVANVVTSDYYELHNYLEYGRDVVCIHERMAIVEQNGAGQSIDQSIKRVP